ncbi:MAG: SET domain-containing protein [Chloroflexota bacterium]
MDVYVDEINCHLGQGVFAGRAYRPGELVLRVTGRVIDHQTIFSIQVDWDRHIDPDPPYKYLNHSCSPNLGVCSGAAGLPELYALREIAAGEQLTFDYAMTEYCHYPRLDPQQDFDLTCYCGAPNCRGRLGYYSELSEADRQRYSGFISAYLLRPQPEQAPIIGHQE